ncbi:MAG: hypothetical protein JSS20_11835, partial [Proteobacteria bacterium]|nr:hypothetical protein [Pseudomonadota bacterium]
IAILLNPRSVQKWHNWLIADLKKCAHFDVEVFTAAAGQPIPSLLGLTFQLEGILFKTGAQHAAAGMASADLELAPRDWSTAGSDFDLLIDCSESGEEQPGRARRIMRPLYNQHASFLAAVEAIIDSEPVRIALLDPEAEVLTHEWGPLAVENYGGIILGLNCVFSRMCELISFAAATDSVGTKTATPNLRNAAAMPVGGRSLALHLAQRVGAKLGRTLNSAARRPIHWYVGWRTSGDPFDFASTTRQSKIFHLLRDDRRRFYADPVPFQRGGRTYIFVEEFPFATGKGVISVALLGEDGSISQPEIVLEADSHLSYPHILEAEGQLWMVPENGNEGRVDLYRAVEFPRRWRREQTILEGVELFDATLHRDADGYWLFGTSRHRASSSMDNLVVYRASALSGPWSPHRFNPVLVDARWSRPGGSIIADGGRLLRPTQDCSHFYGGGLSIAEFGVTAAMYRQRVIGRFSIDCPQGLIGCHTYNRSGAIELIDAGGRMQAPDGCVATYSPMMPGLSVGLLATNASNNFNPWIMAGHNAN